MSTILLKPYSFSISIGILALALYMLDKGIILSGGVLLLASIFIFSSFSRNNIQAIKLGELLTYIGVVMLYIDVIEQLMSYIHLLLILSFIMFHLTLRFVIKEEYVDVE